MLWKPSCLDCGTKQNISPYLFGFWICNKCRLKRGIKLYEEFLERKGWGKEERQDMQKSLESLRKEMEKEEKQRVK